MNERFLFTAALAITLGLLIPNTVAGQTLKTPWGDPDLGGTWSNATTTPLERPAELAGKEFLTDEEVARRDTEVAQTRSTDRAPRAGDPGTYNEFWWERGRTVASKRTALITDPPDGRLPTLTAAARAKVDSAEARRIAAARRGQISPDGPEDMDLNDRCILGPTAGPPLTSAAYNNNFQIFQTPQYVAIFAEYMHQVRIIPLDRRPHVPSALRQWMGDSRGHWEGKTLVVETTNFNEKTDGNLPGGTYSGSTEHQRLIERFTRVDQQMIDYRFTLDDPTKYTRSWSAAIPLTKMDAKLYEYACHEGNYGLHNILAGSVKDRAAANASR
jgi:hypothetical protein